MLYRDQVLGRGSYGTVCWAQMDELPCAAKLLHNTFFKTGDPGIRTFLDKFHQECSFLSEMRHPHIVQFLGMAEDPDTNLPVLLIEVMDESLTELLNRSTDPLPHLLQVSLCHDIVLALAYLHANGVIHRDLSSNNVLLIAGKRAKVSDFGMSKVIEANPRMTPLTLCPGTTNYMPPEALVSHSKYTEKLDCFSFGVVALQVMTRIWPDPAPGTISRKDIHSPTGTVLVPVPEVVRRKNHIDLIDPSHPLLDVVLDCLRDKEEVRPTAQALCHCIAELKEASEKTQSDRVSTNAPTYQVLETLRIQIDEQQQTIDRYRGDLQAKEAELQERMEEVRHLRGGLDETIQRLQQKEQELDVKKQALVEKDRQLQEKDRLIGELQRKDTKGRQSSYKLTTTILNIATVGMKASFSVDVIDTQGQAPSAEQEITAELRSLTFDGSVTKAAVEKKPTSGYTATYVPYTRGIHQIYASVNEEETTASPCKLSVYPDPWHLGKPCRIYKGLKRPWGIAINSHGEVYITEFFEHCVTVFNGRGGRIESRGRYGPLKYPRGIAIDRHDCVYVASGPKLWKFTREGELVKFVGVRGSKGTDADPRGVHVHRDLVYICDAKNHQIHIFDLSLSHRSSLGNNDGLLQFKSPYVIAFDTREHMYIADQCNNRILVLDPQKNYKIIQQFGHEGSQKEKLNQPSGLCVVNEDIYVSDSGNYRIAVFNTSGEYVTSFGRRGCEKGEFGSMLGIAMDTNTFLYVCDFHNNRIQVF